MSGSYSQFRAMMAIYERKFEGYSKKPLCSIYSAWGFPLVFILVFGFIGGGGTSVTVALKNPADSSNFVIRALHGGHRADSAEK